MSLKTWQSPGSLLLATFDIRVSRNGPVPSYFKRSPWTVLLQEELVYRQWVPGSHRPWTLPAHSQALGQFLAEIGYIINVCK